MPNTEHKLLTYADDTNALRALYAQRRRYTEDYVACLAMRDWKRADQISRGDRILDEQIDRWYTAQTALGAHVMQCAT